MNKLYFVLGITSLAMGSFVIFSRYFSMSRRVELIVPVVLLLIIIVVAVIIFTKRNKSN